MSRWQRKRAREARKKWLPKHEVLRRIENAQTISEIKDLYSDASDSWLYIYPTAETYSSALGDLTEAMVQRSRFLRGVSP